MKLKILYKRNLKLTPGKLAAQCCHAAMGYNVTNEIDASISIAVLKITDKKYYELIDELYNDGIPFFRVFDAGFTEVEANTETCCAFLGE